ncbi:retrovirus-related pol polyprotein from transposon TNT 1-94 [Tanacetum coccineum]
MVETTNPIRSRGGTEMGKFDGKADDGFFVGYSTNSKVYRVFNIRTRIVEENLHVKFSEEIPNIARNRPNWLFDIDALTISMNYKPAVTWNQTNEVDAEADMNNLATIVHVSPIPTTRVHKDHPLKQIIRDIHSSPQTRRMTKNVTKHVEPKKVIQALTDPSWIKAMQDELLHFKLQKVWTLVDLPYVMRAIGTKWVYINTKYDKGIMVRSKERLVAQGYTQEEGIYYDEVFAPVAKIEAIRLLLAYASFMNFIIYQMDVKSAFLYGTIEEEVYVCQPLGFEDPEFPNKVYKVKKALYGLHQAPRAWYETLSTYLLENRFRSGTIDKTLFIKKDKDDILLVKQKDDEIFIKFDFATVKTASTPMETNKALLKDEEAADVDVHLYRSMIGSLMYLTASRPDIMFVACACARFHVTPKTSQLHAVKRIFRYLKGHLTLGLWYPRDSPFDLEAFSDSDYHTIVANFTTKAEYVDAANCCGHNLVFHSKTKHIEIRHHFIRDSYEKRLIQVIKIHTDHNVADLFIKAFDVSRFQYLIARYLEWNGVVAMDEFQVSTVRVTYYWQDETVIKVWEDRMERAATTASSLEVEQDSGNGPRCQDTILGVQKLKFDLRLHLNKSYDSPLSRVNTLRSGKDSMKLKELMEFCTKLFATAKAKTVNGECQIQALVDKKNVIITKKSARSDLMLEDAERTECLPNDVIFEQLTLMGYENLTQKLTFYKAYFSSQWKFLIHTILQCLSAKTTAWNEFSSTMASAIICLATNQKFNFSKYIFDHMMKNLEGGVKFLMYPRFVQVFLDKQVEGMSKHKGIYVTPSHTKKIFANMKREGKGFSRRITPLFQTMMVQAPEDMGEDSAAPTDSHSTPIITQPSSSKPQKKKSKRKQRKDSGPTEPIPDEATNEEPISTPSCDPPQSGEDRLQLTELMNLCTKLQKQVLDLEEAKTAQAKEIASLKKRVKQLEKREIKEDASKHGRKIADLDDDDKVTLIDETQERNDEEMFDVQDDLQGEEVVVEKEVAEKEVSVADPVTIAGEVVTISSTPTTTIDKLTLAQTLIKIKATKHKAVTTTTTTTTTTRFKARGVVVQEPSEFKTTSSPSQAPQLPQAKDKGKAIMVEPEKSLKKKDQIALDEEAVDKSRRSSKRASTNLEARQRRKKKKGDKEEEEMKKHMEIVQDDEGIDREDLETLWKLVKAKHGLRRKEEDYERVLWGDLKSKRNTQHCNNHKKAQTRASTDNWNEMCYQLLKLMTKQSNNPGSI